VGFNDIFGSFQAVSDVVENALKGVLKPVRLPVPPPRLLTILSVTAGFE